MGFSLNPDLEKILNVPYPFDIVDANRKKAIQKFGKDFLIDFGIGDPTDETPDIVRSECKRAVDERKCSGYPETLGNSVFKHSVCSYLKKRFNVSLSEGEVVATYGAKYASFRIPGIFIEPGKGQISFVPNPGYPPYTDGTLLAGGIPHYLNLSRENGFEPELQSIESKAAKNAKIFFCNSPHSPTGMIYSKQKLKEIVDFCNDNRIVLVSDECYSDLYFDEVPKSVLEIDGADECAVVLNSLSKRSRMTGYAVGFFASKNPDLLKPFALVSRKSIQGIPTFIQDAAAKAFTDESHVESMKLDYKRRMETMLVGLKKIGCNPVVPKGTFFLWAEVPENETPLSFSEHLLSEHAINCVPGNLISHTFNGVNPGKRFVRFAMVQSVEKTQEATIRMLQ